LDYQSELEKSLDTALAGIPEALREHCRNRMLVALGLREDVQRMAKMGNTWNKIVIFYENFQRRV
jgi:hypothetical protein